MMIKVDPRVGKAARDHLRIGVDNIAEQNLGADTENLRRIIHKPFPQSGCLISGYYAIVYHRLKKIAKRKWDFFKFYQKVIVFPPCFVIGW